MLVWLGFLFVLIDLCPSHRLVCHRASDQTATVRVERQLLGVTLSARMIHGVLGAEVEQNPGRAGRGEWSMRGGTVTHDDTSRVVFATLAGPVPLIRGYIAGLAIQEHAAAELNAFFRDSGLSRAVVLVPTTAWVWVAAGFLGFAAVGLMVGAGCDCVVDLERREVRLAWARVPRRWVSYPLDEVERFGVMEVFPSARGLQRSEGKEFTLGMRLRGGEEVSLTRQSSSWASERLTEIAGVLERFRRQGAGR